MPKLLSLDKTKEKHGFILLCARLLVTLPSNMTVTEILKQDNSGKQRFSFEVLPPLKGSGTAALFNTIDLLKDYNPLFINITTHHSEYV